MDATLILVDSDAELGRARALVDRLWTRRTPPMSLGCKLKRVLSPSMSRASGRAER